MCSKTSTINEDGGLAATTSTATIQVIVITISSKFLLHSISIKNASVVGVTCWTSHWETNATMRKTFKNILTSWWPLTYVLKKVNPPRWYQINEMYKINLAITLSPVMEHGQNTRNIQYILAQVPLIRKYKLFSDNWIFVCYLLHLMWQIIDKDPIVTK